MWGTCVERRFVLSNFVSAVVSFTFYFCQTLNGSFIRSPPFFFPRLSSSLCLYPLLRPSLSLHPIFIFFSTSFTFRWWRCSPWLLAVNGSKRASSHSFSSCLTSLVHLRPVFCLLSLLSLESCPSCHFLHPSLLLSLLHSCCFLSPPLSSPLFPSLLVSSSLLVSFPLVLFPLVFSLLLLTPPHPPFSHSCSRLFFVSPVFSPRFVSSPVPSSLVSSSQLFPSPPVPFLISLLFFSWFLWSSSSLAPPLIFSLFVLSPFSSPPLLFPQLSFPHINSSLSSCCVSPPLLLSLLHSLLFPPSTFHSSLPFFSCLLLFLFPSSPVPSSQLFSSLVSSPLFSCRFFPLLILFPPSSLLCPSSFLPALPFFSCLLPSCFLLSSRVFSPLLPPPLFSSPPPTLSHLISSPVRSPVLFFPLPPPCFCLSPPLLFPLLYSHTLLSPLSSSPCSHPFLIPSLSYSPSPFSSSLLLFPLISSSPLSSLLPSLPPLCPGPELNELWH